MSAPSRTPRSARCSRPGCDRWIHAEGLEVCCKDVSWLLGITYRQLDYWVREGHLHPIRLSEGKGNARTWPKAELEVARKMGRLTALGLPLDWVAAFVRSGKRRGELAPGILIELTRGTT